MVKGRILVALFLAALAVSAFAHVPAAQAQCSMCVTALENSPEGKGMAASFNRGILFLLAVPYCILGTAGIVLFRAHRRKQAAAARRDNPYIPKQ
jgi:hypothetical protein